MDALKRDKINKVFLCSGIAKIISETSGISRRQFVNIRHGLLQP